MIIYRRLSTRIITIVTIKHSLKTLEYRHTLITSTALNTKTSTTLNTKISTTLNNTTVFDRRKKIEAEVS